MNSVNLIARLAREPQLRELSQGTYVCDLRLAVDGMGRGRDAGYITVAVFGRPGEAAARVLDKGWLVAAHGELAHREWTGQDAAKRSAHSIVGSVDFLASPRNNGTGSATPDAREAVADEQADEIPF